jgi:hypothetical protein
MTSVAVPCNSTTEIWYSIVAVQLGCYHSNLDKKQQTYGQFLISAVRIRTLGDFEDIKAPERIWTLSHSIIPLEANLRLRLIHHHLRQTNCC